MAEAKSLLTYPDITWDDYCWDITEYEKPQVHQKTRIRLYFSKHRLSSSRTYTPYEQPFADFAKAIIRTRASERHLSFHGHSHMILALRYLYDALVQTGTVDPTRLTRKVFLAATMAAKSRGTGHSIYCVGKSLREIANWMDDRDLTPAGIHFSNPIPNPDNGDGLDPESQARGLLKMPSAAAIDALAEISSKPTNDNERILLRIVDLLAIGGFRIGEALSLPLDCWVETPALDERGRVRTDPVTGGPIVRYGIRYWPEKDGQPFVKWLSDIAAPLAQRAITDLRLLCHDARTAAELLERNPDRVPLPGLYAAGDLLDHSALATILGFKATQSVNTFLKKIGVKPVGQRETKGRYAFLYRVGEIEKALLKRRGATLIVRHPDGHGQMLSHSLCVMFRNQFHPSKATLRFLPELIGMGQIDDALGNDAAAGSIFSLRGLTEPDGSPMRIKTNAFRHWLNTLLNRGGLSDIELARWSGRRNIAQNVAYKHGTVEQRVKWAREMIRKGHLRGPVADIYHSMTDPVEKEEFLETFVNVALFTPYGVCVHDYAIDPCPYHLNCLEGCSEYLRTKGDKNEQKNIRDVRDFHLVQLQRVKRETTNDIGKIKNYQNHCERIIEGANSALAVDKSKVADGQLVKVFPNGKRAGKPIHLDDGRTI